MNFNRRAKNKKQNVSKKEMYEIKSNISTSMYEL